MNEHQKLAIAALANAKGDDTARARAAFRGLSDEAMQEQHGMSGKTRAQILAEYEAHDKRIDAAICWVRDVAA